MKTGTVNVEIGGHPRSVIAQQFAYMATIVERCALYLAVEAGDAQSFGNLPQIFGDKTGVEMQGVG
nr:hypothetical protein [Sphingopyxis sp. BSNA05]